jgi:hypothetical protein
MVGKWKVYRNDDTKKYRLKRQIFGLRYWIAEQIKNNDPYPFKGSDLNIIREFNSIQEVVAYINSRGDNSNRKPKNKWRLVETW